MSLKAGHPSLARLMVVAIGAAAGLVTLVPPAHATFPGQNGKITLTRDDFYQDVWALEPSTGEYSNLTNHPYSDGTPAWSPDGRRIAFYSGRDGGGSTSTQAYEIYAMNADGSGLTRLTFNSFSDSGPAWSPDGTKLAFHTSRGSGTEIHVMNSDGSGQTLVVGGCCPEWSPDGSRIVFNGSNGIETVRPDGSNRFSLGVTGLSPTWSPDGTQIAFYEWANYSPDEFGDDEVFVVNADGSNLVNVSLHADLNDWSPVWSPDGKRIAMVSQVDPSYSTAEVFAVNPDGSGGRTQLTDGAGNQTLYDWQPLRHDHPRSASSITTSLVPAFRQTISATQCAARGGTSSSHGAPLSFSSCNPPGYLPGTQARLGPAAVGSVEVATVPGDTMATGDQADVTVAVSATDVQRRSTGGDYDPNASGPDLTISPLIRLSDTDNGAPSVTPATTLDFGFPVPITCAATPDPSLGSACSANTTFDAVTPGTVKEFRATVLAVNRLWLNDSGSNGIRGDGDDRQFAQSGFYVP